MFDLGHTFLASVKRRPDAIALVDAGLRLSYAEWFKAVRCVAGGLEKLGLSRGDHLITLLKNRWEMATLHWACQFAGIVITPLNWRAKADEIDYCISDSGAQAVVQEAVDGSVAARGIARIGVGGAQDATASFHDWLAAPTNPTPQASVEDLSLMLYTSGTTGKPKGVPRRHRVERISALAHVAQNRYALGERTLGVMPLYHTMGVRSLLALALIDGLFVCMPKFDPQRALQAIVGEQLTHLYLVPTLSP